MHVIVRALLLPWIVTFAAAAGVVKLNTKADPVEAVVEVFKRLHPAATEAALAVAMNEVASVLKGLEASDTSTENVAFEDENERRRAAEEESGECSDITSREVCKNDANKADCSWSMSREKCKSKRKKCTVYINEAEETCEADKNMARTLDSVGEMVWNHTTKAQVAPIGTTTLGHGVDPDDYKTLDDYQLPMRRRLEDGGGLGVLGLDPADLNLFERAGFVVPFDWECQTGTSGGVYPCPDGIPSTCRANTGGVSSACAKCYCEVGSHTCCPYYSEDNTYSEDGYWYGGFECPSALLSGGELVTDSAVNYCEVGDAVSALYDDGESYSATVTEVTGSDITVTYSDDDTSTYDLTESGNVVQTASGADCVTTCDSSTLDTEVWGSQWWNDPYVTTSYINFKVTRYELADAFGVEFYSTEGDTLKVFSTGDVHFKPDNAERTVYINEQVEYEYETDIDRRLSTAEAVLGDIDLTLPIDHARLVEARYRHSNTRGGSQKPAACLLYTSPSPRDLSTSRMPSSA